MLYVAPPEQRSGIQDRLSLTAMVKTLSAAGILVPGKTETDVVVPDVTAALAAIGHMAMTIKIEPRTAP